MIDTEQVLTDYVTCALWSSVTDDETPMDAEHDADDIAPETLESMRTDVEAFLRDNADDCETWQRSDLSVGHDLWLTRNGHGTGFWDRFYGDSPESQRGDRLAEASKLYGECNLYLGDNGLIYHD